jgi:hypothetical protein
MRFERMEVTMGAKLSRQAVLMMVFAGVLGLVSAMASATPVTPKFRFLNFYADGLYSSTAPDNVDYFVNGSQLCAWGPANGSTTTTDCAARGDGGMSFPENGTPVTSVEWYLINKDEPPATREWFHNSVSFTPAGTQNVTAVPSDRLFFGTLTYTNGSWASFGDARVELSYELTFTTGDPVLDALYDFEYSGVLVVDATPNNGATRQERADLVYLRGEEQLGSLRAYELADVNFVPGANTVSVDIYGCLASVHFTDFANVQGGGFVDPGVALQLTQVPEPGTFALALAAFGALFGARYGMRTPWLRGRAGSPGGQSYSS